jgi:hypothetical protein
MSGVLLLYHTLLLLGQLASCLDVPIPLTAPAAAFSLSRSFVSLSIEADRWTDWVGTTSRNDFFFNTLDNLQQLTGIPPQIRIGGNSEDHTNIGDNVQFSETIFPAVTATVPYPEATNITVGDEYYGAAKFLPKNTHVIWGLNLGQNNLSAAFLEAKALVNAFNSSPIKDACIVLEAIEIGNEADLYSHNGARPKNFTSTEYVAEWIKFATNVSAFVPSCTSFLGASFAASSHSTSGFSPQAIFDEEILSSPPGSMISTISQHHYSGTFCFGSSGVLRDLMAKATIRGNLTDFAPDIAATIKEGRHYILGETNSYSCHGAPGVSNTAGAALWALDYLLFASQLGISRVFFHDGIGFKYNLVQPVTLNRSTLDGSPLSTPLPPHIQPQYYAAIIAAEAIGNSGNTQVIELNINDTTISGYAFYQGAQLKKAILINSLAFFTTTTTPRPSTHVDLTFASATVFSQMNVKRLFVPHADDTSGLTWGGQTYETSDARVSGSLETSTVDVTNGVDIQATEVVMLTFLG